MGLLFNAANAWMNMQDITYEILLGRKGKLYPPILLDFRPEDFPHLAGLQYATDIDFGLRKSELYGGKLISKILNKTVNADAIEKSKNWDKKIRGRLESIIKLEETFDSGFSVYSFNPDFVPHKTTIEASYIIKNLNNGTTFFLFVDEEKAKRWYCRSIFQQDVVDFTVNQARLTLLKMTKRKGSDIIFEFTNPNYKI